MDYNEDELQEQEQEGFANEMNANPSSDDFDEDSLLKEQTFLDEESTPGRFHNRAITIKKAIGKRNEIVSLLRKPSFWIPVGVVGFILLYVLLSIQMDYDLVGVGNPKPQYYQTPSCGNVVLTWEKESYTNAHKNDPNYEPITDPSLVDLSNIERFEYKEYDYDTFITGVVWSDNYNALDVDNEVVYQAMAITARSRLIAELPDNCVVLRDYNEQGNSFKELNGSEEKYNEIVRAVQVSKGVIIGRDGKIIPAEYDSFSYTKKRQEEEENSYFYHMMNENEQGALIIPADWVVELESKKGVKIKKEHVLLTRKFASLSIYGAKYFQEKIDTIYDLYRILETFFGRDIEYYTIDSNFLASSTEFSGTSGCMWWPVGSLETTDENGILFAKGSPSATKISSPFGYRNINLANASTYHKAIDISGGGQDGVHNIIAAADGEVIEIHTGCVAGDNACGGRLGNYVKIKHSDGTVTRYGHLYSVFVSNGDKVRQGQVIGKMGNTGNSTGVHLDFQVLVNGTAVNPLNYVSNSGNRNQCSVSSSIITGNSNSQSICLTLKDKKYSDAAIAGIMANLEGESGFNPLAKNVSSGASGIAQWLGGRLTTLKNTYGANWITLDAQINYLISELNTKYTRVNTYLFGTYSASEMAQYVCTYYEIPATTTEKAAEVCRNSKRPSRANNWRDYSANNCS